MLQHLAWFAPLTGMRASEIAALKVADVRSGIMIVQSGKTESARRRVPVHSQLRNIVEERRACSNDLLFPEFHGLGKNVTKHFGRFLDRIYPERRVGRQATKTFHSYRHWTNSELLREAVPPHVVQQIMSLVSIDLIRMRPSP
jgi:integrase